MGLFSRDNREKIIMYHYEGLPLRANCPINLILDEDEMNLIITEFGKKQEIVLPISKITKSGTILVDEIVSGNMLGRAVVGGILFGGAGAIVGAMTAEEKKKVKYLCSINYVSSGKESAIVMRSGGCINEMRFFKKLNNLLPKEEKVDGTIVL